jgi:D-alanyl-D-alanine carboxypeptidase/D-alanyl-D-alanine-endopeptidase (penicillin-binding protein 4)
MAQAQWGVDVRSLDTGDVLYQLNPHKLMMPASNMKIVTLAAAAETLGWDYRFTTTLESSAAVVDGALAGDLVVRGTGDPTINERDNRAAAVFDDWASQLRALGVTRIDGRIIGDDNAFDDRGLGAGWAWDDLQYGYSAPTGALQFDEDVATLAVRPGAFEGDPASVSITPGSGLMLLNRAYTGAPGSADTIDYVRHLDRSVLEVTGSIAADAAELHTNTVAVVNPTVYFAQALKNALEVRGIAVAGAAVDADDILDAPPPQGRRALVVSSSPPLRDIATVLMKVSQNLYAETLLKAIGAATGGIGTTEGGRIAVQKLLDSWSLPPSTFVQADGSGLSRYDYVTAEMLVTILTRMAKDPRHHDAFTSALPIAGTDGTLRSRMKGTFAAGNAIAKTGSIANVRTLSGYVRTRGGETLVFSILANAFAIPPSTVTWIADLAVEVLANAR